MIDKGLLQYIFPAIIIVVALAFRIRRMSRSRPLQVKWLWVAPTLLILGAAATLVIHPPTLLGWSLCVVGLIAGGAIGWQRGRMMRITHDPQTGQLSQTASPAAMILLVAVIALRYAARSWFQGGAPGAPLDERALIATDVLLLFAVGLIGMTRIEMTIRVRRILAEFGAAPR